MPEGDTIWRTAAALRQRIGGQVVRSARPASLAPLAGSTVSGVEAAGKHLLIRFSSGLTLHTHMRMHGSWHLYQPGERWRRPQWQARAVLDFDSAVAVAFAAPVVELVRDPEGAVAHLGPDILSPDFQLDEVIARARKSLAPTLGEMLLDQRICAGIGNVYKCESLWELGLDPWLPPAHCDEATLRRLYATARTQMRGNLTTWAPRRFAHGRAAVHGRAGRPCPRCGTPIAVRAQGEHARMTFHCPGCQRRPAAIERRVSAG